jgi:hypothetical protein
MASSIPNRELAGLVALRVNYPFQAATLSAYKGDAGAGINTPVLADDSTMSSGPTDNLGSVKVADSAGLGQNSIGSYSGKYGLGALYAVLPNDGDTPVAVRPFRRFLTAQSIFRREVFAPPAGN